MLALSCFVCSYMLAHASQRMPNFTKKHFKNSPHFIYVLGHALENARQQNSTHDGASVLACVYQLKVWSKNSKNFEYWLCRWLWVKFTMFLLSSTSVDAGAIIGDCYGTSVDACAIYGGKYMNL